MTSQINYTNDLTDPCLAAPLPTASNVNFGAVESTANAALLRPGRGYGCVWSSTMADVVIDGFGVWL